LPFAESKFWPPIAGNVRKFPSRHFAGDIMSQDPLRWIDHELQLLDELALRRRLSVRTSPQHGQWIEIDGRQMVNFGSNDYLALAADPRLAEAAQKACETAGWGAGASPLVTGRGRWHAELEAAIAAYEGTEAALLFPTGFAANAGTIAALMGKDDVIFSDAKNHASIIDGCRLSGAKVHVFPHNDMESLAALLSQMQGFRRRLIVTDSLFSMDGDFALLGDLARLAGEHDAMLMVDEAHATGVIGDHGRGVCEQLYAEQGTHIRIGTLSKALGSAGGFVAGSQRLIDYLTNTARSYIFSTALPEATAAAALEALRIAQEEPWRREALLERAHHFRERLWRDGWWLGASQSQIVPIRLGDPAETLRMSAALRDQGFFVPGIRPPSVPEGESLLRISITYAHDETVLERLANALLRCTDLGGADSPFP
jgi:8-amino-7-oxononanoate synthase